VSLKIVLGIVVGPAIATGSSARACSPPPPGYIAPIPDQTAIDRSVRMIFKTASYIAQVVVITRPGGPVPGRLRVIATIKGRPPNTISVPLPDPCFFYFQVAGQRWIVSSGPAQTQPNPLSEKAVASLRRQGLGRWTDVR
jgi:hypothetical protein